MKMPQGIEDESSLRLRAEGDAGELGQPPGDLYVVCHVVPHSFFKRQEKDLFCEVSVGVADAALGGTVQVPTIEGKPVELSIPSGTQSGTVLRLKGKGMPSLNGSSRGNQLVTIRVTTPSKLTDKEKELFQQIKLLEEEKKKGGFFKF